MDKSNKTKPIRVTKEFYDLLNRANSEDQKHLGRKTSMASSLENRFKQLLETEIDSNL